MLNTNKAFSSFSVNDIQKAKEFYSKTPGLQVAGGPEGPWLCHCLAAPRR
jgi:catechol 2,3-dioxygenase-like lactoylglutathione lyase family enzyme